LRVENLGSVYVRGGDALAKASNLAYFLEEIYFAWSIAVDTDAGRVVTTVLLAGETVAEDITDFLAILGLEKAAVAKNSTHDEDRVVREW
jgi:hypothetical protein